MLASGPAAEAPRHFYPELEALRGLAALSVVLLHANLSTGGLCRIGDLRGVGQCAILMLSPGNASVALFFVLSGFVLSLGVWQPSFSFPRYLIHRLFRLMPAMWAAIAVAVVVYWSLGDRVNWQDTLHALYFAGGNLEIDPPLWTMRQEIFLSILFLPVVAAAAPRLGVVGSGLVLVALYWCFTTVGNFFAAYMMYLGCLVPTLGVPIIRRLRKSRALSALVTVLAAAAYMATIPIFDMGGGLEFALSFAAIPSFLAVSYFVAVDDGVMVRLMRWAPVRFLGRISYSVYVLDRADRGAARDAESGCCRGAHRACDRRARRPVLLSDRAASDPARRGHLARHQRAAEPAAGNTPSQ
jgi:peptidoglycan/LPS O-acetylase OafA/YrhL